jgi:hypothetical protein
MWLERMLSSYGATAFFSDPIHEELTQRIFGCDGDGSLCSGTGTGYADPAVLVGVRWNDDPPFRLSSGEAAKTHCKTTSTVRFETQPRCWLQLFKDAERRALRGEPIGPGKALLYRTHFGDLQFLHAMGPMDGALAANTQKAMLEWAEFTWRVAIGDLKAESKLRDVTLPSFQRHFGYTEWSVRDLFALGTPALVRKLDDVAFGSMLHMLQDSFAAGHVERLSPVRSERCVIGQDTVRAPGHIVEFHSYGRQDHDAHAASDGMEAKDRHLQEQPDVVDLGRLLVEAYDARLSWPQVEPYFHCVFRLAEQARPSSAGSAYMLTSSQ